VTGRVKHAQRSKYSNRKKYIPAGTASKSIGDLISNTKKADRPDLIARLLAPLSKPRESRTKREES
jgi:hypothetical protein